MISTAERIVVRRSAAEVRLWLQAKGVDVLDTKILHRTPVLSVRGPVPHEMTNLVNVLVEKLNGQERRSWLACVGGCHVHWREPS